MRSAVFMPSVSVSLPFPLRFYPAAIIPPSLLDESEEAKKYYEKILRENAEEYQQMIQDYSDEG